MYLEKYHGIECRSWNKCTVGCNLSFGVVTPGKEKPIIILCEVNEIKDKKSNLVRFILGNFIFLYFIYVKEINKKNIFFD